MLSEGVRGLRAENAAKSTIIDSFIGVGRRTGNGFMAARTNPLAFFQQVRAEVAKVVWPSRRESMISTLMVFVMVILAAMFFFAIDQVLGFGVGFLLGLGN